MALPSVNFFETPLGRIPLDRDAMDDILALPHVVVRDDAHAAEHSLEVQLPFLQNVLEDFKLVPLAVSKIEAHDAAEVLRKLWGGNETVVIISSDLSHFLNYEKACVRDRRTSHAIERLAPEEIGYDDACGRNAVNGLLTLAREKGLAARTVDLRNSGDTAGDRSRVVGYGAYFFE